MRKFLMAIATVCTLFISSSAYAELQAYTTAAGSTVEKTEFGLGEQPYVYLTFTDDIWSRHTSDASTVTSWAGPGGVFSVNQVDSVNGFWLTPSDWTTYKAVGSWTIDPIFSVVSMYDLSPRPKIVEETFFAPAVSFKVVPEPVSAGLFVLGGAALAITRRKKA